MRVWMNLRKGGLYMLLGSLLVCAQCTKDDSDGGGGNGGGGVTPSHTYMSDRRADSFYPMVQSTGFPAPDEKGNIIPDFSRTGYRWGDQAIPDVRVMAALDAPGAGMDAWEKIQNVINLVSSMTMYDGRHRGAILLKKGIYEISKQITIPASGVVLRGEGNSESGTVLVATGTTKYDLIRVGPTSGSVTPSAPSGGMNIKEEYVPVGRFWLTVTNAGSFRVGDEVIVYRPYSEQWVKDLKMDQIPQNSSGNVVQWNAASEHNRYTFRTERVITRIDGDTLHFDNPIVMPIESEHGGGAVYKYTFASRISECGIENMLIKSTYKSDTDEDHGWTAIIIDRLEHGWVKNVSCKHFGFGLVSVASRAKHITVTDCSISEAKSLIQGDRRYSVLFSGQLCLAKNISSYDQRHDYVTGAANPGPNAYVNSIARRTHSEIGPHQRWNMGTLYDNIDSSGQINVHDRGNYGSGHGWTGVVQVLWNCKTKKIDSFETDGIAVQSPWVTGKNYSIGTVGTRWAGRFSDRPAGEWISQGKHVSPQSLYEAQMSLRKSKFPGGVFSINY